MIISTIVFYALAGVLILSSMMVITSKNPVHSVLFLILAFFNAAGLCVLLGAEFIAMLLVIVYVGAVAVLFLFVVMMLDINFKDLQSGFKKYMSVGGLVGGILLAELIVIYSSWSFSKSAPENIKFKTPDITELSNTEALGRILYTDNLFLFQIAGLILLVAMIGAITLTLRTRDGVMKQDVSDQVNRKREDVVKIVKVETGTGVA